MSIFYHSTKHRADLRLSHHLPNCTVSDLFRDFSLAFFINWKWNIGTSEPASSNRGTKQRFVNISGAVSYVIVTWEETKVLKEETKWTVRVSCSKQKKTKMMKDIATRGWMLKLILIMTLSERPRDLCEVKQDSEVTSTTLRLNN